MMASIMNSLSGISSTYAALPIADRLMNNCVICRDPLKEARLFDVVELTGCGHLLHAKCCTELLTRDLRACPTCRSLVNVTPPYHVPELSLPVDEVMTGFFELTDDEESKMSFITFQHYEGEIPVLNFLSDSPILFHMLKNQLETQCCHITELRFEMLGQANLMRLIKFLTGNRS